MNQLKTWDEKFGFNKEENAEKREDIMIEVNQIINQLLSSRRSRSARYYTRWINGVGNRKVKYTRYKIRHNGKVGFGSWVEVTYKNSNKIKRFKIGVSATKKSCEKRVKRLIATEEGK